MQHLQGAQHINLKQGKGSKKIKFMQTQSKGANGKKKSVCYSKGCSFNPTSRTKFVDAMLQLVVMRKCIHDGSV